MSEAPGESAAHDDRLFTMAKTSAARLRVMRREDIPAGLRLTRASHWNQLERDWDLFLTLSPDGCRVAIDQHGEIVGSVATLRYGTAFSWIAMVLVDPAHRRNGIGSQLLQEALTLFGDVKTVRLDATPAGHPVYSRAGFFDEYHVQRMQRLAQPLPSASETVLRLTASVREAPVARIMEDADLAQVLAQDLEVFGADRRPLLEAFREQTPEYAWVCGRGTIDGYLFGRPGYSFQHMGPLVARDESTASRLLTACLAAHQDRAFIVDAPARASWTSLIEALGFTVQRPFIRMYRGQPCQSDRSDHTFAIAGPEFG